MRRVAAHADLTPISHVVATRAPGRPAPDSRVPSRRHARRLNGTPGAHAGPCGLLLFGAVVGVCLTERALKRTKKICIFARCGVTSQATRVETRSRTRRSTTSERTGTLHTTENSITAVRLSVTARTEAIPPAIGGAQWQPQAAATCLLWPRCRSSPGALRATANQIWVRPPRE